MLRREWSTDGATEDIWISVSLKNNKSLHICCVYNPPFASAADLTRHLTRLFEIVAENPNDHYLILGDYNEGTIVWAPDGDVGALTASNVFSDRAEQITDSFSFLNLDQYKR